jgi:poly(ribitol-phosphate) beta-N-acetylglucosaminyltransferase
LSIKVSVVVPVWNPGPNIQRCLDGLLTQTMADTDYELVFVDDGSTDGTGTLLDAVAQRPGGPHIEVVHIPNSGWPGRPRNVGVDTARGEYVHFVDNDDTLAPTALDALYELAGRCDADIVIGKPASDFRYMSHRVYRENVLGTTLTESPWLVETLTPHKMFRRSLLVEHDIRHPEGPVPFEDQIFIMQAYVHARSIAILADRACYYYVRRLGSGRHAGDRRMIPTAHCDALARVLDIIDAGVPDREIRDRLYRRFYRTSILSPIVGAAMIDYDPKFRAEVMRELRALVDARFAPSVHEGCGAANRMPGRLFLDDDADGLVALSQTYRRISLRIETPAPAWRDDALLVELDGELRIDDAPLHCDRVGDGWALPAAWAPTVPVEERVLDERRNNVDLELSVVSRVDHEVSFPLVDGLHVGVDADGCIRVSGTVAVDPMTAMGGAPLSDAVWDLRLRLSFAGINRTVPVRWAAPDADAAPPALEPYLTNSGTPVIPYWTGARAALALDVGQWSRSLAEQLADRTTPAVAGAGVQLQLPLRTAAGATFPPIELLFQPVDETPGDVVAATADVTRKSDQSLTATATPLLDGDGTWRLWWTIGGSASPPAVPLPWSIRRAGPGLVIDRVS